MTVVHWCSALHARRLACQALHLAAAAAAGAAGYWFDERSKAAAGRSYAFMGTSTYKEEVVHGVSTSTQQLDKSLGLSCNLVMYDSARKGWVGHASRCPCQATPAPFPRLLMRTSHDGFMPKAQGLTRVYHLGIVRLMSQPCLIHQPWLTHADRRVLAPPAARWQQQAPRSP